MKIDTGDTVLHHDSGETWVVAHVENGVLFWCGWPLGCVPLRSCELVKTASAAERDKLLRDLAAIAGDDPRKTYAMRRLAEDRAASGAPDGRVLR